MPRSDNALFKRGLVAKKGGSSVLICAAEAVNRPESLLTVSSVFPSWKVCASSRKSCYAIFCNPWIVLVAIYTVHSGKQETFWLQWTYSARTIPRGRAISCIFQKADLRPRERKSHGSDRTRGSEKKDSFTERKSTFSFLTDVFGMEPFPVTNLLIFWCNWALCAAVKSCVKAFFFSLLGLMDHPWRVLLQWYFFFFHFTCTQLCHRFENPLWPVFLPWRHPSARGRFTPLFLL